ncbi:MAG: hypothetical protein WCH43_05455 [Verrucomicrobiota bacterium]
MIQFLECSHSLDEKEGYWMEMVEERIPVPGPEDPWWQVGEVFALTFNAYDRVGDFDHVAKIGNRARKKFDEKGILPEDIDEIRTCLFFEQRRWRHFDGDPYQEPEEKVYLQALFAVLSEKTGGSVAGPSDPWP